MQVKKSAYIKTSLKRIGRDKNVCMHEYKSVRIVSPKKTGYLFFFFWLVIFEWWD